MHYHIKAGFDFYLPKDKVTENGNEIYLKILELAQEGSYTVDMEDSETAGE